MKKVFFFFLSLRVQRFHRSATLCHITNRQSRNVSLAPCVYRIAQCYLDVGLVIASIYICNTLKWADSNVHTQQERTFPVALSEYQSSIVQLTLFNRKASPALFSLWHVKYSKMMQLSFLETSRVLSISTLNLTASLTSWLKCFFSMLLGMQIVTEVLLNNVLWPLLLLGWCAFLLYLTSSSWLWRLWYLLRRKTSSRKWPWFWSG